MARLPPPPASKSQDKFGDPSWQNWFYQLYTAVTSFNSLDFTGSNITSIATRNHNDLQNIQGGSVGDYQHLTSTTVNTINSNQVLLWLSL